MTPRIALPVPTSTDLAYNQRAIPAYKEAIRRSGGEPVQIGIGANPAQSRETIREIIATCQGVCLPGSPADVDPTLYGADRDPETAAADPAREGADRLLLDDARKHGKPVLAICFGVQFLNVWQGGSLVQHLTPMPVNHAAGSKVAIAHTLLVAKDSLLASLCDPAELVPQPTDNGDFLRLPVNTSHHQSVAQPGPGLRISARCPDDGVIEAVELDPQAPMFHVEHSHPEPQKQWLLGVQWHPERSYDISATSRNLFGALTSEARKVVSSML
jgi:putative glutamine amidotransferase